MKFHSQTDFLDAPASSPQSFVRAALQNLLALFRPTTFPAEPSPPASQRNKLQNYLDQLRDEGPTILPATANLLIDANPDLRDSA